jgi:hypothetical protein
MDTLLHSVAVRSCHPSVGCCLRGSSLPDGSATAHFVAVLLPGHSTYTRIHTCQKNLNGVTQGRHPASLTEHWLAPSGHSRLAVGFFWVVVNNPKTKGSSSIEFDTQGGFLSVRAAGPPSPLNSVVYSHAQWRNLHFWPGSATTSLVQVCVHAFATILHIVGPNR